MRRREEVPEFHGRLAPERFVCFGQNRGLDRGEDLPRPHKVDEKPITAVAVPLRPGERAQNRLPCAGDLARGLDGGSFGHWGQNPESDNVDRTLNDVKVGDRVRVMETRPLSKSKRWRVTDVLERAR